MNNRELFILDVGHGNCALLRDEKGIVLIDAGPGSALLEFLRKEAITTIDVALLSHAHADHISGLIALLSTGNITLGTIRLNLDASQKSNVYGDLLYLIENGPQKKNQDFLQSICTADTKTVDPGTVGIEILAPHRELAKITPGSKDLNNRTLSSNSLSVVIRLMADGEPVALFPGDIDTVGFDHMMNDGDIKACHARLVVFPHHGGKPRGKLKTFVSKFCRAVKPEIVIFSIGRGRYHTPNPELVDLVRQELPDARILCTQLSEHCSMELPADVSQTHLTERFSQGRQKGKCCGGTLEINLDDPKKSLLPQLEQHQQFIQITAPNALCRK